MKCYAFNRLLERLKQYLVVGGMPAVVFAWSELQNLEQINILQSEIITSYELDFAKHSSGIDVAKIWQVWDSIPAQLARENKKYSYSTVKSGGRARGFPNELVLNLNQGQSINFRVVYDRVDLTILIIFFYFYSL